MADSDIGYKMRHFRVNSRDLKDYHMCPPAFFSRICGYLRGKGAQPVHSDIQTGHGQFAFIQPGSNGRPLFYDAVTYSFNNSNEQDDPQFLLNIAVPDDSLECLEDLFKEYPFLKDTETPDGRKHRS